MKRYRIKPQGVDEEVGRILIDDNQKVFIRLDFSPGKLFLGELIDDTSSFIESIKSVMPDAKTVEEMEKITSGIPDPINNESLENNPL